MTPTLPITIPQELIPALLDGRKTQHRTPVDPQPDMLAEPRWSYGEGWAGEKWYCGEDEYPEEGALHWECPYGRAGQRLFVREVYWDAFKRTEENNGCVYRADYGRRPDLTKERAEGLAWRPPSRMPQRASRIALEVEEVRVQRIKRITVDEMKAEGALSELDFIFKWNNANRVMAWAENYWVWAITFKRINP